MSHMTVRASAGARGALRLDPRRRHALPLPKHLSDAERAAVLALAQRLARLEPRIASLRLFGSRARGDSRADSDLDLAVAVRGRRDALLERNIVAAFADVEWNAPLEGALRISPLVRFSAEPRAAIDERIDAESLLLWKARG